jgi:hypothetical protein
MRMLLALSAIALTLASSGNTATVIPVGEFRSVALSHGGRVVVRHGAVQRRGAAEDAGKPLSGFGSDLPAIPPLPPLPPIPPVPGGLA